MRGLFDDVDNVEGDVGSRPKLNQLENGLPATPEPRTSPSDVTVVEDSIGATEVTLTWTQVDTTPEVINGFFRGYRIQFGKTSEWPMNMREQDKIFNDPLQYPRPRVKRDLPSFVEVKVNHLPPYSDITLQVRVLNKYYAGPPSDPIQFRTTEGKPGPPAMMDVVVRGSTHFEIQWEPPYEPNGRLIGYNISYQTITGLNLGRLQYRQPIEDPTLTRARLTGLMPDTYYRVFLSAATRRGKGEPIFLDMKTTPPGPPSPPSFAIVGLNETYVNVTWEPSRTGQPGSVFFLSYRVRGKYEWQHTPDEYLAYAMALYDLDPGTTYQIRVVSKNGEGLEAPSPWQEFTTAGVAPGHFELKVSMWFYGIFIAIFLILVLFIAFYFIKKETDEQWEKKEADIAEQVRELQAQEFASGFMGAMGAGVVNQYADTGSRTEGLDTSMGKEPLDDAGSYDGEMEYEQGSRYLQEKRPEDEYDSKPQFPEGYSGYGMAGAPQVGYHPTYAGGYDPSAMVRAPTPTGPEVHGGAYVLRDSNGRKKDEGDTFV